MHRHRNPLAFLASVAVLGLTLAPARGQDASRLPDWKGQWIRTGSGSFDPTKPAGLRQDAPLIPEYQTILEASVAAQAAGGQGNCRA